MLLSAVSVLVVAQSSSEIPEGLMNNLVFCQYTIHHLLRILMPLRPVMCPLWDFNIKYKYSVSQRSVDTRINTLIVTYFTKELRLFTVWNVPHIHLLHWHTAEVFPDNMHVLSHKEEVIIECFSDRKFCDSLCYGNRRVFCNLKLLLFILDNKNTHLAWCSDIPKASTLKRPVYPHVLCITALTTRDIWMAPCIFSQGLHRRSLHYYTTLFLQWCRMFLLSWNTSHLYLRYINGN